MFTELSNRNMLVQNQDFVCAFLLSRFNLMIIIILFGQTVIISFLVIDDLAILLLFTRVGDAETFRIENLPKFQKNNLAENVSDFRHLSSVSFGCQYS